LPSLRSIDIDDSTAISEAGLAFFSEVGIVGCGGRVIAVFASGEVVGISVAGES